MIMIEWFSCGSGSLNSVRTHRAKSSWITAACFLMAALVPLGAGAQDAISPGETLDLGQCITLSLAHHPSLLGAQGSLKSSTSRLYEAKSGYYPQVSASASYSRARIADTADKQGTTDNFLRNSVDARQTIFDFGKTSAQVQVQSQSASASQEDLRDVTRAVVFNVKQAYYGILQSKQTRDSMAEAVKQFQLHLDQARRFYEVGLKPKIDVTTAEVNLGQARLGLLNAENGLRIARVSLNNAMGLPDAPAYEIREESTYREYPADLDAALAKAYEGRPDMSSARFRKDAARSSVDLAHKGYYPSLSGNAGYSWSGSDYPLDDGWSIGATLDFPVFNGFLTRYQEEEARGNLMSAEANEKLVRQNVRFDVEQAYYTLQNVREKIALAELTLRQARENRELAIGRYQSGVGSSIEVADAVTSEVNARSAYVATLYDYRIAVASLEKAMGEER